MRQFRIALLIFVCVLCGAADTPSLSAQHGSVTVDWKAELAKAKAGIEKNPQSAFWHNQAGVAYNALGDSENAVKELKLASTLDPSNPIHDYALYALYKRKGMHSEQRDVLLEALEKDPKIHWDVSNLRSSWKRKNVGQTLSENIRRLSSSSQA